MGFFRGSESKNTVFIMGFERDFNNNDYIGQLFGFKQPHALSCTYAKRNWEIHNLPGLPELSTLEVLVMKVAVKAATHAKQMKLNFFERAHNFAIKLAN